MIILPSVRGFLRAPTALAFINPPPQVPNTPAVVVSARSPVSGTATISGGISAQVSNDGVTWGASASITAGGTIYARSTSPAGFNTSSTATVTIGGTIASFTITNCTTPTYTFPAVSNVVPGGSNATGSQPTGCSAGGAFSLTSSAGSGPTAAPNPVGANGNFVVSYTGRSGWSLSDTIGVSLNGYTASFVASTPAAPTFVWGSSQSVSNAPRTGNYESPSSYNTLKFSGIVGNYTLSATGTGVPQVSRDSVNWSNSLVLTPADNGNWIAVRVETPPVNSNTGTFTLTYGTMVVALGTFKVA